MAIVTTTTGAVTTPPNQRKTGRLPNGGLLDMIIDGTTAKFFHSKDGGVNWAAVATGGTVASVNFASLFTDENDGLIYVAHNTGNPTTVRCGTAAYDGTGQLTTITWTTINPFPVTTTGVFDRPDLVAHKEGAGWKIHVVAYNGGGFVKYQRVNRDAAGALTNDLATELTISTGTATTGSAASIAIDINKTLYSTWNTGATGAGKGIRAAMATYLNGNWTWQAEEIVTEALFADIMGGCLADKAGRVVVALRDNAGVKLLKVYRRASGGWTDISPVTLKGGAPTLTLHTNDDPYLTYLADLGAGLMYRSYSGGQWSDVVPIPTLGTNVAFPTACRYTDGFSLDIMCTTGAAAPFNVEHLRVSVATPGGKSRRGYNVTTLGRGRRGVWTV